jgi:hypothetical protein
MPVLGLGSGRFVDPTKTVLSDGLAPEQMIGECCVALAHQNRYAGHAGNYTVAQHCLILGALWTALSDAIKLSSLDQKTVLFKLLTHDLHEAYVVDLPRPLKMMLPEYCALEKRVEDEVQSFISSQLPDHNVLNKSIVKQLDSSICTYFEIPRFRPPRISPFAELNKHSNLYLSGLTFLIMDLVYCEIVDPARLPEDIVYTLLYSFEEIIGVDNVLASQMLYAQIINAQNAIVRELDPQ